jgi:hypothetical protein
MMGLREHSNEPSGSIIADELFSTSEGFSCTINLASQLMYLAVKLLGWHK